MLDLPKIRHPPGDPDHPSVKVLAYQPEYDPPSKRWFVDIAVEDGPALWPFIRLALARYQSHSIVDCSLSPVSLTSWVQPLPTRTTTVSRPRARAVRVTVTGTVALLRRTDPTPQPSPDPDDVLDTDDPAAMLRGADDVLRRSRSVHASLQVLPAGASDLEWRTIAERRLPLAGIAADPWTVTWSGELRVPEPGPGSPRLELRTPGNQPQWRVLVEEQELLEADPVGGQTAPAIRTVYTDAVTLRAAPCRGWWST
jgi:hypothetical protein